MSTVAQRLRMLANELDDGGFPTGPVLVPVVARDVKVGDVVTESVGERLTVSEIAEAGKSKADGTPLLRLAGRLTTQISPEGYESSYAVWADQYVVVER